MENSILKIFDSAFEMILIFKKEPYSGAHISWHELFLAKNQGNYQNFDPSLMPTLFNILLTLQFHILFNIPSYLIDPTLLFALNDDLYPEFRIPKAELKNLSPT